jgi:hypothetical protein
MYYQYNLIDIEDPFYQEEGTIYWLEICSGLDPSGPGTDWGWKSSEDHWNDDAVWRDINDPNEVWHEIYEPSDPIMDTFWAYAFMGSVGGGGSGFGGGQWFYYPDTGWWNQWFYDGVFDPDRAKVVLIEFDLIAFMPGFVEIALNYSTDAWPSGSMEPPLPGVFPEDLYIERVTVLEGDVFELEGPHRIRYVIRDYNPEWVSIDIRVDTMAEFEIPFGMITHDCVQSLDLAFVITGEPWSGCPNPGMSGSFCTADCYPNNGDGVWNYPADDGDCIISIQDLATLLSGYGMTSGATREDGDVFPSPGGDGAVNIQDLATLLSQYGDNCN